MTIPAGTAAKKCAGPNCKVLMYFIPHPKNGRPHPVSCELEAEGAKAPTATELGVGVSHFTTCVDRAMFFGKKANG